MTRCHTQTNRRAIIEDIKRIPVERQRLRETFDHVGEPVKGVVERPAWRCLGLAEARQVRRNKPIAIGQKRNQVAKHVAGRRETMQQQDNRRVRRSCLAIEYVDFADWLDLVSCLFDVGVHLEFAPDC